MAVKRIEYRGRQLELRPVPEPLNPDILAGFVCAIDGDDTGLSLEDTPDKALNLSQRIVDSELD